MATILVTGYIGSHTCVELLGAGFDVVVVDNLSNSKPSAIARIAEIAGKAPGFVEADLLDPPAIHDIFDRWEFRAVLHFAGLKAVGESTAKPLPYYRNNVGGTLNLLAAMERAGVRDIVFSSSCTVHGAPDRLPLREDAPLRPCNPYGGTKLMIENILRDVQKHQPAWNVSVLRYFNPVGAHASGLIGEDPSGIPDNLMPYIQQVAVGRLERLRIFGSDYPTRDGTGVRDYVHVTDLALGHLYALQALEGHPGLLVHNLGTGQGHSVLDVVNAFEEASGRSIPHEFRERRPGDVAESWADPTRANEELGWKATRGLEEMCRDAWNWQQKNPAGLP
jgi:UDP-glucose 4-epimerase